MAGLDIPNSGNILFNNINLSTISKDELSQVRLNNFGFVYQFHHLLEDLTIEENIQLPSSLLNNLDASKKNLLNDVSIEYLMDKLDSKSNIGCQPEIEGLNENLSTTTGIKKTEILASLDLRINSLDRTDKAGTIFDIKVESDREIL